jgi:hypothetical protein
MADDRMNDDTFGEELGVGAGGRCAAAADAGAPTPPSCSHHRR